MKAWKAAQYGGELEAGVGVRQGEQCFRIFLLWGSFQMKGTHPAWPQDVSLRVFFSAGFPNGWCGGVGGREEVGQTNGHRSQRGMEWNVPSSLLMVLAHAPAICLLFQSPGLLPAELSNPQWLFKGAFSSSKEHEIGLGYFFPSAPTLGLHIISA